MESDPARLLWTLRKATKVTRSALQHASSISGLLLTTECLITELPEKKAPAAGGDHHGHDHGGGGF